MGPKDESGYKNTMKNVTKMNTIPSEKEAKNCGGRITIRAVDRKIRKDTELDERLSKVGQSARFKSAADKAKSIERERETRCGQMRIEERSLGSKRKRACE